MEFDMEQYLDTFLEDARSLLETMTSALLNLEQNPADREAIAELFRVAHTLKSSSAMVGQRHTSEFTHGLESILHHLREGEITAGKPLCSLLFQALDLMHEMIDGAASHVSDQERERLAVLGRQLLERIEQQCLPTLARPGEAPGARVCPEILTGLEPPALKLMRTLCGQGLEAWVVTVSLEPDTPMPNVRAFLILTNLRRIAQVLRVLPDPERDSGEGISDSFSILAVTDAGEDAVREACQVNMVQNLTIRQVDPETQTPMVPPLPAAEAEPALAAGLAGAAEQPTPPGQAVAGAQEQTAPAQAPGTIALEVPSTSFDRPPPSPPVAGIERTERLRVAVGKLDAMVNLTGELVINRGRLQSLCDAMFDMDQVSPLLLETLAEGLTEQARLLEQLRETVMGIRMVPIGQVFNRFRRLVRDLADTLGRDVDLQISGGETELDKKIVDQIGEPLTHMLRNAVDHGVEPPAEREAAGKSRCARIVLSASRRDNVVVIDVSDDGRGIDYRQVAARAVEAGLLDSEQARRITPNQALELIFAPGFSTSPQVTDLSGRGVGMDVVRRTVDMLGGGVEIETEPGQGTQFRVRLPLTLAIGRALIVRAGCEQYALPIGDIREIVLVDWQTVSTIAGSASIMRLRDQVIPLISLGELLAIPGYVCPANPRCTVIGYGDRLVGIMVDAIVNEQEIVIKAYDRSFDQGEYIAGSTILGDGRICFILDALALVDWSLRQQAAAG